MSASYILEKKQSDAKWEKVVYNHYNSHCQWTLYKGKLIVPMIYEQSTTGNINSRCVILIHTSFNPPLLIEVPVPSEENELSFIRF